MDVLEPKLVWVNGRCYRFCDSDAWTAKDHASTPYVEDSNPQEFSDLNDDTCPPDINIVSIAGGKYKHSFYMPQIFFRFLIGSGGATKKRLERDTKTLIKIPRVGGDGDIEITSSSKTAIISARHQMNLLAESSKKRLRPTHFIAIPMRDTTIISNFEKFKNAILNESGKKYRGVEDDVFQKPEKMHLTLGMLLLVDNEEVKSAMNALEECYETLIKPITKNHNPIKIKVQGLEYFNDDPSEVSVLYGKVSSKNNILQEIAEKTNDFFVERGLMRKERDNLNLHLTLMNAKFLEDKGKPYKKFDATDILKIHKDYFFGETVLKSVQLCNRGAKAEDGYYKITSEVHLVE